MEGFLNCLLLLLLACASEVLLAPPTNTTTYTTGPFTILYSPSDLPTLQVKQQDKLVWFTSRSSSPFLTASKVTEEVTQIGGDFTFNSHVEETCTKLRITEVGVRPSDAREPGGQQTPKLAGLSVFFMRGVLCDGVAMEVTLQAAEVDDGNGTTTHYHLRFNFSMEVNEKYNQLHLVYGCEDSEGFYGFGAQYSRLNMKGKVLPMFLSEQGVGRGLQPVTGILDGLSRGAGGTWSTTYTRVPHYITSRGRSLYLESLEYASFDFTKQDTVTLQVDSNVITGRIISGSSPLDMIRSYTALIGRLPPLPKWVGKGAVLGLQGGSASVLKTLSAVEQGWGNISDVVGVWLQDWTGQRNFSGANDLPRIGLWWNWEVDDNHYPQWTQLVSSLRSKGIRMLTYINPLFSNVSERGTPFHHNYFEEGLEKGYFVKTESDGVWTGYSNSTLLDIANPQAYDWMVDIIAENMLGTGACGWMCDFGESLPLDAVLQGNHSAAQLHALYPSLWGRLNADAIERVRERARGDAIERVRERSRGAEGCTADDVVYFMRSGNARSPAHTRLFWLGDQMVTWDAHDGLATVVMGMLSQGLSGYSLSHSDIGGYTALLLGPLKYVRSKELYLRWCELAAFTTMYRSHLGTLPTHNWQFDSDKDTMQHFFKMAVVFQSWEFYRAQLMEEAAQHGWPVVRHMMLAFPDNAKVYEEELTQQFMLGDSLLVAPVVTPGQVEVEVFLPSGSNWVLVFEESTVVYEGADEYVKFPAPLGRPCVLYNTATEVGPQFVENLKRRKLM